MRAGGSVKSGIWCPATRTNCDRPCIGAECQRVKLAPGSFLVNGGVMEDVPRPPDPDTPPVLTPAQCRAGRAYLGLSCVDFAKAVGVSSQTIYRFEVGSRTPRDSTLRKIIGAFYDRRIEVFGSRDTVTGIRSFPPPPSGTP